MTPTTSVYQLVNFNAVGGHADGLGDAVLIHDGVIAPRAPSTPQAVDLQGFHLAPGFIDLQLNGCGGVLFNAEISSDTLDVMHNTNLKTGCTTFLPTLITSSDDDMRAAIEVVRAYKAKHPERVPGLHLEGPYLSFERKGIHNDAFIRIPSPEMIDFLCDNADVITMITLAPENVPTDIIKRLSSAGIIVSLGHTNASAEQARAAEQAGATFATHLHNAMSPLTSREAGVVGAIFDSEVLGAGIIADGHHLSWENLRIARKIMGDRLVLVTDATTPAGTDMPTFEFAGQTIYHADGKCSNVDGTLAGSALTMIEAVANSVKARIPLNDAIDMATWNAAAAINDTAKLGGFEPGRYANFVVFDDNFKVRATISGGEIHWF